MFLKVEYYKLLKRVLLDKFSFRYNFNILQRQKSYILP